MPYPSLSSELSVITVSEILVNKVARNIAKAIQLFSAKYAFLLSLFFKTIQSFLHV